MSFKSYTTPRKLTPEDALRALASQLNRIADGKPRDFPDLSLANHAGAYILSWTPGRDGV